MAATVLSFGLKFIPIPKKSIHQNNVDEAIKHLNQDFHLKVFFADDNKNSDDEEPIESYESTAYGSQISPPQDYSTHWRF